MRTFLFALALFAAPISTPVLAHDGIDHSGPNQVIEWIPAEVIKIDVERSKITLKHGPMRQPVMAAMTMPFHVADPDLLKNISSGQKVRFRVTLRDDELWLTHLERAQ